jgi:hypothetical protein
MPLKRSTGQQDRDMRAEIVHIDAGEVLSFIRASYAPEEVFEDKDLAQWATEHGYVLANEAGDM